MTVPQGCYEKAESVYVSDGESMPAGQALNNESILNDQCVDFYKLAHLNTQCRGTTGTPGAVIHGITRLA